MFWTCRWRKLRAQKAVIYQGPSRVLTNNQLHELCPRNEHDLHPIALEEDPSSIDRSGVVSHVQTLYVLSSADQLFFGTCQGAPYRWSFLCSMHGYVNETVGGRWTAMYLVPPLHFCPILSTTAVDTTRSFPAEVAGLPCCFVVINAWKKEGKYSTGSSIFSISLVQL